MAIHTNRTRPTAARATARGVLRTVSVRTVLLRTVLVRMLMGVAASPWLASGMAPPALAADAGQAAKAPAPAAVVRQGTQLRVPADSPLRSRIATADVSMQAEPHQLTLPAVVEADPALTTNVLPPLAGRIVELKARLGDAVHRGQLLAVISSPDLAMAYADAEKAQDALALARRELERSRGLLAAGSGTAKDVEAQRSAVRQAEAEDQRTRARLSALTGTNQVDARTRLLRITAPVDGVVSSLNVGTGAFANDTTAALMTISDLNRVWVSAQVPENQIAAIAPGQPVTVTLTAYPRQPLQGTVAFIAPVLDPDSRRVKVRIGFANPDGHLKPNMFGTAVFSIPQPAGVTVPTSALLMNNDDVTVFVETAPWTFERRAVTLGDEDGGRVRILSGLAAGDRVVVSGGVLLND